MSWRYLLFALPLAGCTQEDPVWEMPCEERPAREVLPGTGEGEFKALSEGPVGIEYGDQGGSHIWFSVRMRGFGPTATIEFGITDPADPEIVYSGPQLEARKLEYNSGEEASEARGLFAFVFEWDDETMMGRPDPRGLDVLFWAQVRDECAPDPVRGEALGEVE